jgi:tryptophan-rich sensory protein
MLCGRICFFGLHNPMLAGIEIIVLWLMILRPTHNSKINKIAGYLLPYLFGLGQFAMV